jgi:hypothetical protein
MQPKITLKQKKIKLWKDKYHVVVRLYNTVKELQKEVKDKTVAGMYRPELYIIYPKLKIPLKLGTIYLAKERLGVGYITHEVLHCIIDYGHKVVSGNLDSLDYDDVETQEKLCIEQGYITKEICNWLNNNKLWD